MSLISRETQWHYMSVQLYTITCSLMTFFTLYPIIPKWAKNKYTTYVCKYAGFGIRLDISAGTEKVSEKVS